MTEGPNATGGESSRLAAVADGQQFRDGKPPQGSSNSFRPDAVTRRTFVAVGCTAVLGIDGRRVAIGNEPIKPAITPGGVGPSDAGGATGAPVELRSGTNPAGPPQAALDAAALELASGSHYPRTKIAELREALASHHGAELRPENVAVGAGSIELVVQLGILFGRRSATVVTADPTWKTAAEYAVLHGARWSTVPLDASLRHDFAGMLERLPESNGVAYLCNPNNPTGVAETRDAVMAFVERASLKATVVVDEAFIDCLDDGEARSVKHFVKRSNRVVVLRTFSKMGGMAGFRVGYALGPAPLLAEMAATVPRLEMHSRIGAAAAIAAIADGSYLRESRARLQVSRTELCRILRDAGLHFVSSDCNFVSFEVPKDAEEFRLDLATHGVDVKNVTWDRTPRLRVSCGSPQELQAFGTALHAALSS